MKILTVLGARPQFVKASVVSAALRAVPRLSETVVHTGQHFDDNMSGIFFEELGMKAPDLNLGIHGGGHGEMTGRMIGALEGVLRERSPDLVLVYGDTNSTLAGALAAAKLRIPVAHVEAGLRSFNRAMPEEVNRVLTDHASALLFAPTSEAVTNLAREGIAGSAVHQVGDVMYDVALRFGERAARDGKVILERLGLRDRSYVLVTIHRQENTDDPDRLGILVGALAQVALELPVVWPVHPRTRGALERGGLFVGLADRVKLIEPQGYLDMVRLESHAAVIATDSGGVQKEAYFHRVPCVTLRSETEWVELIQLGWNRVAPATSQALVRDTILSAVGSMGGEGRPYGDGRAAERIVGVLDEYVL